MFKKGVGLGLLGSVILMLIVFAVIIFFIVPILTGGKTFMDLLGNRYSAPELSSNAYFTAESLTIYENGKQLDLAKDVPSGCSKISGFSISCKPGTSLEFVVGIKNTGTKTRDFYARPRIGYNCLKSGECKAPPEGDEWLTGDKDCTIQAGLISDCQTVKKHPFNTAGKYRIYPGAICYTDCFDPEKPSQQGYPVYNKNVYLEIEVK